MTPSPNAVAAAPNDLADAPPTRLYRYNTRVEFPLKESLSNAPVLLQKLLATLVSHCPGMTFYAADDDKIDIEEFPKAKKDFDKVFNTTVTEERNQRIVVGFEIRSALTFRKIKTSVWNFLLLHHIFVKKHPGPLKIMDLVSLGWIHKAHPSYTSHTNVRSEILTAIGNKLLSPSADETSILSDHLDTPVPDMFFSAGRVNGTYEAAAINSNVLFIQVERSYAKHLRLLLEITFVETDHMNYIPISLKRDEPALFGKYLCLQNEYLENHRNISIAGISPEAMDYSQIYSNGQYDEDDNEAEPTTLWNHLLTSPGVIRIDSCSRTPDLGKWNFSTTKTDYIRLTEWLDEHLESVFHNLPASIKSTCTFTDFPVPRRLSRNPIQPSRSQAHHTSSYTQLLAKRVAPTTPATVVRSAWRPFQPVVDVSYAFDEQSFPPMKPNENETKSTATTSHLSSLSENAIQNAINNETTKLKAVSKLRETAIDIRIQNLEATLHNLTTNIVSQIYAKMSGPDSPFVTISHLDSKLERLSQQIEKLYIATSPTSRNVGSPTRKQARITGPEEEVMAIDSEPPGSSNITVSTYS
jgi:hypothetical protein